MIMANQAIQWYANCYCVNCFLHTLPNLHFYAFQKSMLWPKKKQPNHLRLHFLQQEPLYPPLPLPQDQFILPPMIMLIFHTPELQVPYLVRMGKHQFALEGPILEKSVEKVQRKHQGLWPTLMWIVNHNSKLESKIAQAYLQSKFFDNFFFLLCKTFLTFLKSLQIFATVIFHYTIYFVRTVSKF